MVLDSLVSYSSVFLTFYFYRSMKLSEELILCFGTGIRCLLWLFSFPSFVLACAEFGLAGLETTAVCCLACSFVKTLS